MKKIYIFILGVCISFSITAQTISQIQGTGATSPYVGQSVTTSGVVTAIVKTNAGDPRGYYIQDGAAVRSGIYVYDNANIPTVGDNVTLTSDTVKEYYDMTELTYISSFTVNSQGNNLPTPIVLTPAVAGTEDYESVLVMVYGVLCTGSPDTYGVWTGTASGQTLKVDDQMLKTNVFTPVVSVTYDVTGIMNYDFGEFKIEPRTTSDVPISSDISELSKGETRVFPIPAIDKVNMVSERSIYSVEMFNVIGESVFSKTYSAVNTLSVDVSGFETGMYMLKVNYRNSSAVYRVIVK